MSTTNYELNITLLRVYIRSSVKLVEVLNLTLSFLSKGYENRSGAHFNKRLIGFTYAFGGEYAVSMFFSNPFTIQKIDSE